MSESIYIARDDLAAVLEGLALVAGAGLTDDRERAGFGLALAAVRRSCGLACSPNMSGTPARGELLACLPDMRRPAVEIVERRGAAADRSARG